MGYRWNPIEKPPHKEFCVDYEMPNDAVGTSPVTAIWLDGHKASISKLTCEQKYPAKFPIGGASVGSALPKKGKGSKNKTIDALWQGDDKGGKPHYVCWRKDRDWLVSIYEHPRHQRCQIKPCRLEPMDAGINVQKAAINLMVEVAKAYCAGDTTREGLLDFRDGLLAKYRLKHVAAATAVRKRPSAEKPAASAKPTPATQQKEQLARPSLGEPRPSSSDGVVDTDDRCTFAALGIPPPRFRFTMDQMENSSSD